jgi:hypothetical protein
MAHFIFSVDASTTTQRPDEIETQLGQIGSRHGQLLAGTWLFEYAGSGPELVNDLEKVLPTPLRFLLVECKELMMRGVEEADGDFMQSIRLLQQSKSEQASHGPSPTGQPHAPYGHAHTTKLLSHLVALEEELALMVSKYGPTDRASELLARSPFR